MDGQDPRVEGVAGVRQESLLPNKVATAPASTSHETDPNISIDLFFSSTTLPSHHRQHSYQLISLSLILFRHLGRAAMDSSSRLLLNSTSSLWGDENACSSSLRARLRDDNTPATSSSTKPAPYQDVYQQVHSCLGNHLLAPKPDKKAQTSDAQDPAIQLRGKLPLYMCSSAQADMK